jgi:hypothetical protein
MLARGPRTDKALMAELGLQPRAPPTGSTRWCRSACSSGPVTWIPTRRPPTCSSTANKPSYVGGVLEMANARLYSFWGSLTEALRIGTSKRGQGRRELLRRARRGPRSAQAVPPRDDRPQHRRGTGHSREVPIGVTPHDDRHWSRGGMPSRPDRLASSSPHRRGAGSAALYNPCSRGMSRHFGLAVRLRFHAGDFFQDPLPRAGVLVMGHILTTGAWTRKCCSAQGLRRAPRTAPR